MKQKIFNLGNKFISHELISGSFFLFLGVLMSSVMSFILNLFLIRNLKSAEYGIYASLLSLLVLLGVPTQSLITVIVRFASDYVAKNKLDEAKNFYSKLSLLITIFSICMFIGFVVLAAPIGNFLNLDNTWYVILMGLIISLGYLGIVNSAFLQSLLKFSFISFVQVVGGILRIITGVILIFLGFKVFGALWAIFLAFFIPFLMTFMPLRFLFLKKNTKKIKFPTKEIALYAVPTSIAIFSLNSLTSIDVILVKHFFHASDAGLYAGLSLAGKIIFYFTSPIVAVMFPLLIRRHNLGQNFNTLFYLALVLVTIPSIGISLFYFLFPLFSVNFILGGGEYVKIYPLLGIFGLFATVFSVLNVCVNFFLSLKKTSIFMVLGLGLIAQVVFIFLFHKTFFQVIGVSLIVSSLLLVTLLVYYFREYGSFNKIKEIIALANNPRS